MKPDMDDYSDIDDTRPNASRAMSWMVLAVAVGGFAALAYYAYHSGTRSQNDGETMTVEADQAPIKEAPADAGGEQFPDKDKTIYDVISPNGEAKGSEKLMPEPEHPVAAGSVEDSEDDAGPSPATNTAATASTGASTFVAKSAGMANNSTSAPQNVAEVPVATTAKPVAMPTPAAKSYAAPEMVNQKTIGKKDAPVATAAAKPVAKAAPKAKPAAAPSSGGAYQVQLGAFKSEAEAQAAWKKLSGAHSDALSGTPNIVQADVNGTTYYRLRAGSFATSADAKALCGKLGGAACMSVK
jgi:cell division septation protein DedD